MRKIKALATVLIVAIITTVLSGCYSVSAQKMYKVKGTYKLTHYTYTEKYERKEGYTPRTVDYVEEYKYEDYLIITGSGIGYYVHKDAQNAAYSKEVNISYLYDEEDSSKIAYVIYNDVLSVNKDSGINKLGVTRNNLNYTKVAFDYTELITKRPMRSEAISVRWEKVDNATDLSYVEKQLGSVKKYDYNSFGARGIYRLDSAVDVSTGDVIESEYQYFYYVIDTAENLSSATVHYALKGTPTTDVTANVVLAKNSEDWNAITLDGATWTREYILGNVYIKESDGIKYQITRVSNDISSETLGYLIESMN